MCLRPRVLGHFVVALLLAFSLSVRGGGKDVAVISAAPEGHYGEIFESLLRGIVSKLESENSTIFLVDDRTTPDDLRRWLTEQSPQSVITLGRQAYDEYLATGFPAKVISGALDLSPQLDPRADGISLSVAPELFFGTLKELTPSVSRVFVVYDGAKNQWIVDRAKAVAGQYGLEMVAYQASDLSAATQQYRTILAHVRPDQDALWIPLDSALLDERAVLPVIVEQSWYRRLAVFSNSLNHARLGALFAIYPDPEKLGARLAERALRSAPDTTPAAGPAIEPLRDVKRALNVRLARHLDVDVRRLSDEFDTYFPSAGAP